MLDFVAIRTSTKTSGRKDSSDSVITIYPEFLVTQSNDLMVRGKKFYAIWDEDNGLWSLDPNVACELIDRELENRRSKYPDDVQVNILLLKNFGSHKWTEFINYCMSLPDNYHQLDNKIVFQDDEVIKSDYASKKLPYSVNDCSIDSYEELMSTLYAPEEREKLEWSIGSIFAGDSKRIDKFIVLYGSPGTGKSTFIRIVQQLFDGYYCAFDAQSLGKTNSSFALEPFKQNPLVAIQHDVDLSKIEDNTKLNSITSHEELVVNEKFKSTYTMRFNSFIFLGTNKPVKITDGKSGIIRRLIDVEPTGELVPGDKYQTLMSRIPFELGGIARHCMDVYSSLGPGAYDKYRSLEMIGATDHFYSFLEESYDVFKESDETTLAQAWIMYKHYCDDSKVKYPYSKQKVKDELKNYFFVFEERSSNERGRQYNIYKGFRKDKFAYGKDEADQKPVEAATTIELKEQDSIFDKRYAKCQAQYANDSGTPANAWCNSKTVLGDLDTSKLHYVIVPWHHIVIDFDKKDAEGNKSLELNLKAASKWPSTYSEVSQGGQGIHLHYLYDGDPKELANVYDTDVEIKVFNGKGSLRRKLTLCNDLPISRISSGLPLKKGGDMIDFEGLQNEKALRTLVKRNLSKEIHPGTKPSIDFIFKILTEYKESGKPYDLTDLRPAVMAFANNSTNHSLYCMKLVNAMPFASDENKELPSAEDAKNEIIFYDVEVFPNLFVIVWKKEGDSSSVKMINPSASEVESLLKFKLVGFNCRRYDNHILYARLLGYDNMQLYTISKRIIGRSNNAMFAQAYNLSYADIYDFSSKKQSLKKFEIELGIHHQELGLPWADPVDESLWDKVADYCVNDVTATEAVFNARAQDFNARKMLASLSGLSVNDTNRSHVTRIIFGSNRHPQEEFVYTDLSTIFEGYVFDHGTSTYRGEVVGEGGYVYSEPGYYENVALLDIESMHPNSLIALNLFGNNFTPVFKSLLDARLAIKHGDFKLASTFFDGALEPYLGNPEDCKVLAYALKIIINSVYGLTSATFDCEFKDPRNIDNIVAKRGALFMVNLKHEVQDRGFTVAHIKTDSIKIPNATPEIIEFVTDYGKQYGYTFDHEDTYQKMCLVNDSVYIAKDKESNWTATGTQFAVPYVFKTLFSHEPLEFKDFCETKTVKQDSDIFLNMNENHPDENNFRFIGRVGQFTPIKEGCGGGLLVRSKDDKYYAVTGSKGFRWLESETVSSLGKEGDIDESYYQRLADEAKKTIEKYCSYDKFVKEN